MPEGDQMLGVGAMADLPLRVDVLGLVVVEHGGVRMRCVHRDLEPAPEQ